VKKRSQTDLDTSSWIIRSSPAAWSLINRPPRSKSFYIHSTRTPPPRTIRAFTYAELKATAAELSPEYRALPTSCAANVDRRRSDLESNDPLIRLPHHMTADQCRWHTKGCENRTHCRPVLPS